MGRSINRCVKKYNTGISKVIPPTKTKKIIYKNIKCYEPQIYISHKKIHNEAKIPQYIFKGTHYYSQIINDIGRVIYSSGANGKGHFKTEAIVSGLMEMAERYSCCKYLFTNATRNAEISTFKKNSIHYSLDDFYSNPFYRDSVEVLEEREIDSARLLWYKAYSLDGRIVSLPISLICYTYELTNGMASGNTFEEALSHAICEIIERHCKTVIRENKLVAPEIDQTSIRSSIVRSILSNFQPLNQKVILKDFSLNMGIPVIGVIRRIARNKYITTTGVAPKKEEAIIRALVENVQIENDVNAKSRSEVEYYLKNKGKLNYREIPDLHDTDIKKEIYSLKSLLEKQKMTIYYIDTTDKKLRIPSVFVYITNTKRSSDQLSHRNIIMSVIEESLRIKDYKQAQRYINFGFKKDPGNIGIYQYYNGLVSAFEKNYKKAIVFFEKSLNNKPIYEFLPLVNINIGICYLAMGKMDKLLKYYLDNLKLYPDIKHTFIRTHHRYNSGLFNNALNLYSSLQSKLFENGKSQQLKGLYEIYNTLRKK